MDINQLYAEFCNKFWIHFLGMESAEGRKTATFKLWKNRIPAVRKAMLQFLNEHGAPNKPPLFWVKDYPEPVPKDYNGSNELYSKAVTDKLVIALYKGVAGIYTRQDAEDFEMTIKRKFEL